MHRYFQKPAVRVALPVLLVPIGTELLFYVDSDRHATLQELAIVTILSAVYFSILEVMVAKGFIVRRPGSSLDSMLRFSGFGIFRLLDPTKTLPQAAARFVGFVIVLGFVGAAMDAFDDHRRREQESQLP